MTLAQKFSSAMNGIDDEFIEEALTYERSKKRTSSRALRIVLVAALISVLLFTSTLALSPSFRVNTLNTLIEISSDHLTISFDGEEAPLSRTAGKIDCSTLEGTYRIPPEHSNRASFFNSVRLFGSSGEEIGINVTVISQTLVGDYDIADDAESKFTARMLRSTGVRAKITREKPVQKLPSSRSTKKTVGSFTSGASGSRRTSLSPSQNRSKSHSPLTLRAMSKSLHSMLSMQ